MRRNVSVPLAVLRGLAIVTVFCGFSIGGSALGCDMITLNDLVGEKQVDPLSGEWVPTR